uniref:Uncharacterized protein n=1 Tax=Meloidogyne enterolobii TaxID=390850 RepID=A0A6V7XEW7_MELEN|nr:unnamed protein product [Meloidogyne enterolobii]CAD2198819.1 unnamed protein product [Meloidogyne enterolobii]
MSTINKEKEFSIEKQFLSADLEDSLIIQEQTKIDNFKPKIVWRNVFLFTILHLAALQGFWHFLFNANWLTFIWTIFLWIFSGMGITAGAHRLWAHRSYKARFPLRTLLMILNCIAFQNDIIEWARDHRCHHKWSDTDADPHNVNRGLFFAHMGWLLVKKHPQVKAKGAGLDLSDLFDDPVLRFQRKYYLLLVFIFCFLMPTVIPVYFWGEKPLTAFLTGAAFRYCFALHATWLINSVAHKFGYRPYDVNISPAESVWTTILAVGEGGHNYHHTFPQDYRTSEMMTPFNLTKAFIDFFAIIGQAYERKVTPISNIYRQMGRQLEQLHKRVMDSHKSF